MLNSGKIFFHAINQDGSMIFHKNLLEASAAFKFKPNVILTDPTFNGKLLDF